MNSHFHGTDEIVEAIRHARPEEGRVRPAGRDSGEVLCRGRKMVWVSEGHHLLRVSTSRVLFMEGNRWYFGHGAGVKKVMALGYGFEPPAARVHRIRKSDVTETQKLAKDGTLLEQLGMVRPWTAADIGQYKAQLLDGNHRAAAAMALGESTICVYVGENYWNNVQKKDWYDEVRG